MPEYFPRVQLPEGLAEELARLQNQQGQIWGNTFQNIGQDIGSALAKRAELKRQQDAQPTGETAKWLLGGMPEQQPGPWGLPSNRQLNPNRKLSKEEVDLVQQGSKQKEAEANLESKIQGMKDIAGLKTEPVPINAMHKEQYKKVFGHDIPFAEITPQQEKQLSDAYNKKIGGGATLGLRDSQFWEKQWVDAGKDLDLTKAISRSPLGLAVRNNMSASRATKLLNTDKKFTPQDLKLVTTDLAAIMKQGTPDEELLRQQQYPTIYGNIKELWQKITANPQDLNVPEIRRHLRDVINGVIDVDNQTIKDHIDNVKSTRQETFSKDEKRAKGMIDLASKHLLEIKKSEDPQQDGNSIVIIVDSKGKEHSIYRKNIESAKSMDPGLKIVGE